MMTATIHIWSAIGDTPLTGRKGSYCDLLVKTAIGVSGPDDARTQLSRLIGETPNAHYGHFEVPEWPNQNTRSGWTH